MPEVDRQTQKLLIADIISSVAPIQGEGTPQFEQMKAAREYMSARQASVVLTEMPDLEHSKVRMAADAGHAFIPMEDPNQIREIKGKLGIANDAEVEVYTKRQAWGKEGVLHQNDCYVVLPAGDAVKNIEPQDRISMGVVENESTKTNNKIVVGHNIAMNAKGDINVVYTDDNGDHPSVKIQRTVDGGVRSQTIDNLGRESTTEYSAAEVKQFQSDRKLKETVTISDAAINKAVTALKTLDTGTEVGAGRVDNSVKDNVVSPTELSHTIGDRPVGGGQWDENTRTENADRRNALVKALDLNGDGKLTRSELDMAVDAARKAGLTIDKTALSTAISGQLQPEATPSGPGGDRGGRGM